MDFFEKLFQRMWRTFKTFNKLGVYIWRQVVKENKF